MQNLINHKTRKTMNVDFNNVRKIAATHLDELIKKLNQGVKDEDIDEDLAEYMRPNIERLSSALITICCCYEPEDEGFADLSDEIDIREYETELN